VFCHLILVLYGANVYVNVKFEVLVLTVLVLVVRILSGHCHIDHVDVVVVGLLRIED